MAEMSESGSENANSLVCTLASMDVVERTRHEQVIQQLIAKIQQVEELPAGFRFRLPAAHDSISIAAEFIGRERLCCPFFDFELTAAGADTSIWLRLTGQEGVKDFLRGSGLVQIPLGVQ